MQINKLLILRIIVFSCIFCGFAFLPNLQGQQRTQFTQYMYDGSLINPAYVGADEALSLTFLHRSQWAGIKGSPQTQTLSAHTLFQEKQFGTGLIIQYETIGVHQNMEISTNYAYHLKVGRDRFFSLGLKAGIHSRNSDYTSISGNSAYDPGLNNLNFTDTYFDLGLGVFYRDPLLQIGFSVPEITGRGISYNDSSSIKIKNLNQLLFARYIYVVNDNISIEPGFLLKYLRGVPLSYDLNLNINYRDIISTGLSYRKNESIDFLLKLQVTPQMQFGYSYDYPIGYLARFTNVSHEIMARYIFKFSHSNIDSPR